MFESSVLGKNRRERPTGRALGFAVVAHGAVVVGVLATGFWSVEAVAAPPDLVDPFVWVELPETPPAAEGAQEPAAEQPAAPDEPVPAASPPEVVQPEVIPEAPPDPVVEPLPIVAAPPGSLAAPGTGTIDGVPFAPPGNGSGGRGSGVPGGTGEEPYHLDARIDPPRVLARVEPKYTELARRMRVEGIVVLEAIIDRTGRVTNTRVLKGLPAGLDQSAMDAVQQWRFAPATIGSRPVPVYFRLTVRFEIH